MARTFYRIIETDEPTMWDFTSNFARGRPPRRSEITNPAEHRAISVFTDLAAARYVQRRYPRLGQFIVIVEIEDADEEVTAAKADDDPESSHYNIWGSPDALLRRVRRVLPAAE